MGKLGTLALAGIALSSASVAAAPPAVESPYLADFMSSPAATLLTDAERRVAVHVESGAEAAAFVEWFWQRRDPVPATRQNEFRAEFQARVAAAEKQFGTDDARVPGWRTARGEVYLLLGPPDASQESRDAVFADDAWRDLSVWIYTGLPEAEYPVRFFFVQGHDGWQLATDGESRELSDQLGWLAAAREWPVVATSANDAAIDPSELRYDAQAGYAHGGIFATISVPLLELLGTPVLDGVQYTFDVKLSDDQGDRRLGVVMARLTVDDVREFNGRDLRLMLWFPDASPRGNQVLRIVEKPSEREIAVVANVTNSPAPRYPVGREVAVAELLHGTGVAVTYLAPDEQDDAPVAWLVTAAAPQQADATPLPGNVLALRREKN